MKRASLFIPFSPAYLAYFITSALSQAISSLPEQQNFLRRAFHRSTILGHHLYIDGGELDQVNTDTNVHDVSTQNTTLSIDLSTSWTNESVTINSIPKDAFVLNEEILWNDPSGKSFYIWGGYKSPISAFNYTVDATLWRFDADGQGGGSWNNDSLAPTSLMLVAHSLVDTGNGVGYAVGGYTGSTPVQGLLEYNIASGSWNNASTSAMGQNGTATNGQLIYTSAFGDEGVLITLSGSDGQEGPATLNDFSNIEIYDIKNQAWVSQQTSGPAPSARTSFCAVGVAGPHSYEIFLHGGFGQESPLTVYDDVYVLSLPSFSWYQASLPASNVGRTHHTCNVAARSQMIVIGGVSNTVSWNTGDSVTSNYRDPWPWGIGVFDLNSLSWASQYNAQADNYTTPAMVTAGLRANGTSPKQWSSNQVQQIMTTTTLNTAVPGAPKSGKPAHKSKSLSGGAIAGIAIGAAVGVFILLGAITLFFLRRTRQSRRQHQAKLAENGPTSEQKQYSYAPVRASSPVAPAYDGGREYAGARMPIAHELHESRPAAHEMTADSREARRHELQG